MLVPALLVPFFAWRIYRRFQRAIGRQPLRRGRLAAGVAVFGLIGLFLLASAVSSRPILEGFLAGFLGGGLLGWIGITLTRFEKDDTGRHFYTPNPYLGFTLTLVLVMRVAYRVMIFYSNYDTTNPQPSPISVQTPLTMGIIALIAGYYVAYNAGVLVKCKR